jgi:tRNA threonylcarbamoyladenosine biosynthesis protein TsaB
MIAVLHAGRGRLAAAWYITRDGEWQTTQEIRILTAKELVEGIHSRTYICGELNPEERRIIARKHKNAIIASPAQCNRRPSFLAEAGWRRWQEDKIDNPATLSPVYFHYGESIPG